MKSDGISQRLQRRLACLPQGARPELLQVLSSPSDVRADLIRQMHERAETRDLPEVFMDLNCWRARADA